MEKRVYLAPEIEILNKYAAELCLEFWSADKDTGGGNTPEGKETDMLVDDDEMDNDEWTKMEDKAYDFPKKFTSVWDK